MLIDHSKELGSNVHRSTILKWTTKRTKILMSDQTKRAKKCHGLTLVYRTSSTDMVIYLF